MRVVSIGGGPAGLYFGILMKQADPSAEITVLERNRASDTFGFGVVFSDATLDNLQAEGVADLIDSCLSGEITDAFTHLMVFAALARARRGELPADLARHFTS